MKLFRLGITAIVFMFFVSIISAQTTDYGTWLSFEVSKKLAPRLALEFEEELRLVDNFRAIDRLSTTVGGSYNLSKNIKAGAAYAWLYKHNIEDDYYENRHRVYAFAQGKARVGRFSFTLRERFQSTWFDKAYNPKYTPKLYLRSRLKIDYKIKDAKIEPYAMAEMHYQLNNPKGNQIDNMRYTLGTEFPLSKNLNMSTYLRMNQDVNKKKPVTQYLLGVSVGWKL